MKKNQYLVILGVLISVVVISGIIVWTNQNSKPKESFDAVKTTEIEVVRASSSSMSIVTSSMPMQISATSSSQPAPTSKVTVQSGYTSYDTAKLANAEYGKVIIFFHASWCPSCKGLDDDIKSNIDKIPSDTLILKLDYDSNQELRKKYNVRMQHTLVQVDKNGELLKFNPGLYQLNTLDSIVQAFK